MCEHYVVCSATQLKIPERKIARFLKSQNLEGADLVFTRVFLKTPADCELLKQQKGWSYISKGAHSLVVQAPLGRTRISFLFYFLQSPKAPKKKPVKLSLGANALTLNFENFRFGYFCNVWEPSRKSIEQQTLGLLRRMQRHLGKQQFQFKKDAMRLWYYVPDIDRNYEAMVQSRKKLYGQWGLNKKTGYKASTGIEANNPYMPNSLSMDCLCYTLPGKNQVSRLRALGNMNEAIDYGVTFDRGTKIEWKDRTHYYISGTASIDSLGKVVYPKDVVRQTARSLKNIKTLLKPHGVGLKEVAYFIVYLRNKKDYGKVLAALNKVVSKNTPMLLVEAKVCRKNWLVEIEAIAIGAGNKLSPEFI